VSDPFAGRGRRGADLAHAAPAYPLLGEPLPLGPWLRRWRHLAETHPADGLAALWEAHKESRRQIVVDVHFAADVVAHLGKSERLARARGLKRRRPRVNTPAPNKACGR
jgi:hypothetical protein